MRYSMVKKPEKERERKKREKNNHLIITANYKSLCSPILHLLKISQTKFSSNDVYIYRNPLF
jgi:hypothetical protein